LLKNLLKILAGQKRKNNSVNRAEHKSEPQEPAAAVDKKLDLNMARLKKELKSSDIVYYQFEDKAGHKALVVYISGFIEAEILNRDILAPLKSNDIGSGITDYLYTSQIKPISLLHAGVAGILEGNVLLFVDGQENAFLLNIIKPVQRAIEEPDSESVIRGPKEGFIESIKTNILLLRRIIKSPELVVETLKIGKVTQTEVAVVYLNHIVNRDVLKTLRERLGKIDVDSILESGYLEEYIEDYKYSPYPTVGNTQKPDVVAGKILEGRIAVFCDGTPHVLTVPFLYIENLQTSEDYYVRPLLGSFLRSLRVVGLLISTLLPSLYVALTTFHQELLPNVLLISIAGAREGIPLPAFAEALLMGIMFELLKESGTRLPRAIGSAISIVGALVIGNAAVDAGLVSAPMVIITAVTAVSSFIIPTLTEAMTFFRLFFLLLGGSMGLIGITSGIYLVLIYTVSLHTFGIPYTASIATATENNMKDAFFRVSLKSMQERPDFLAGKNKIRRRKY